MKRKKVIACLFTLAMTSALGGYAYAGETETAEEQGTENGASALNVTSDIFGSADTGNKSTLKALLKKTSGPGDQEIYYYNEEGQRVPYEEGAEIELPSVTYKGEAVLDLGDDVDDSLIDSSNAVVKVAPGDGYYPEELVLHADKLDGSWENGKYHYTLEEGDIEWYTGDYPMNDFNSNREWSCFGGDGNGCYNFTLEVSGITYDGQPVEAATFPVQVYIWGRDASDMVQTFNEMPDLEGVASESGVQPGSDIQWTWKGDGEQPILCDQLTDDFYVTWPEGTDASALTGSDVKVTLYNDYGVSYQLAEDEYAVFANETETQVAVTYVNWAYTPVYTTMTIEVDNGELSAANTYDIASVYIYMVQQGGGGVTVDGTITACSYYGFANLESVDQIMNPATYNLTSGDRDNMLYYAEDEDGNGYMTDNQAEAVFYDASGEEECNQSLILNTGYITTRVGQTEEKAVDGEIVELEKTYNTRGVNIDGAQAEANGLVPARGYALNTVGRITPYEMWSWQDRFLSGWTPDKPAPEGFPYTTFPYGF